MKTFLTTIVLIVVAIFHSYAQSPAPGTLATQGGSSSGGNFTLTWTIGQPVQLTLSSSQHKLSQGFQQPEIDLRLNASPPATLCSGTTISLPYNALGYVDNTNAFKIQLSNSNGSFTTPVNIGSITSINSGSINAQIPSNTPAGNGYRVRVSSSKPVVYSSDNGSNIRIAPTNPPLNCPANMTVNPTSLNGAVVTYTTPIVNNCYNSPTIQIQGLPSGSVFPIGTTTNKFQYTTPTGQKATCSFKITVRNPYCSGTTKAYVCLNGSTSCVNVSTIPALLAQGALLGKCDWYSSRNEFVEIEEQEGAGTVRSYPNPVQDGKINIRFDNITAGEYQISLVNSLGQLVHHEKIIYGGGAIVQTLILDKKMSSGIYMLIISNEKNIIREKILIK